MSTRVRAMSCGFSLLEVLLATVLLATGLAVAFATLRGAMSAERSVENTVQQTERTRAVQNFMRTQISNAVAAPFEIDAATGEGLLFELKNQRITFVGEMPGYLSRGGLYVQSFAWVRNGNAWQLEFSAKQLTPDGPLDAERKPEILISGMKMAEFEVQSLDVNGRPSGWSNEWQRGASLPPLLRVRAIPASANQQWPPMTIAFRLGQSFVTNGVAAPGDDPFSPPRDGGR